MLPRTSKTGLCTIALLVLAGLACKQLQSLGRPTTLTSPDGRFQLTVPAGWQERPALNVQASIKAGNLLQETYVILITENKSDFADDMTLDRFTELTRGAMLKKVTEGNASEPEPVTINGNAGRQYTLDGVYSGLKLSYLVTALETTSHYHQVITWTLQSRIDQNRSVLEKVTETFRPTGADESMPNATPGSHR
ncbi:MAG TPA: hypothetical protein VKD91_10985 [Pyrinomonadaceae bacterium]|nr:hypothetical protein [Pyrinomonadaceae bacterium]